MPDSYVTHLPLRYEVLPITEGYVQKMATIENGLILKILVSVKFHMEGFQLGLAA